MGSVLTNPFYTNSPNSATAGLTPCPAVPRSASSYPPRSAHRKTGSLAPPQLALRGSCPPPESKRSACPSCGTPNGKRKSSSGGFTAVRRPSLRGLRSAVLFIAGSALCGTLRWSPGRRFGGEVAAYLIPSCFSATASQHAPLRARQPFLVKFSSLICVFLCQPFQRTTFH